MKSDTLKKLRALAAAAPRPWFPERDAVLEGEVAGEVERDGSQFLAVDSVDGLTYLVPRHGPIGKVLRECGAKVGHGLRIECLDEDLYLAVTVPLNEA